MIKISYTMEDLFDISERDLGFNFTKKIQLFEIGVNVKCQLGLVKLIH